MKKHLFKTTLLFSCLFMAWSLNAQIRVLESFKTPNANWTAASTNATSTQSGGTFNCVMGLQSNGKYRGDLQFLNATVGSGISLSSATDKYIAIKFSTTRPDGSLKFEMRRTDGTLGSGTRNDGYYNSWNVAPTGSVSCTDGGYIYYFDLTTDASYVSQTTSPTEMQYIKFIIADAVTTTSYSADWVATFPKLADITTYKDYDDDATTGINSTAASKTVKVSTTKDAIFLANVKDKSEVTVYSVTGSRMLSTTVDGGSATIPFPAKGTFIVKVKSHGVTTTAKVIK